MEMTLVLVLKWHDLSNSKHKPYNGLEFQSPVSGVQTNYQSLHKIYKRTIPTVKLNRIIKFVIVVHLNQLCE